MDDRNDSTGESANETTSRTEHAATGTAPIGLDVGTSKVVAARRKGKEIDSAWQLNAFLTVPHSKITESTLRQNDVTFYREGDDLVVYGTSAERFANMFNADSRRPMAKGLLNAREPAATAVLEAILGKLVPKARVSGEVLAFSIPAAAAENSAELTYHEATLRRYLQSRGYRAVPVNEGLAVVLAELEDNNFTGVGISCGGGMCNVTLAFLSVPSVSFSITKGGDYIDTAVGAVVNEPATRVKLIKEEGLDLSRPATDKVERALHIYYDDLIQSLVESLRVAISRAEKLPRTDRPLPLVLAGGTAMPKGFQERFEQVLRGRAMPFEISGVRLASDPLTATARGALVAALAEK